MLLLAPYISYGFWHAPYGDPPPSGRKDLALTYCTFPLSTLSLLVRALYDVYIEGAHIYTDC